MDKYYFVFLIAALIIACEGKSPNEKVSRSKAKFNQELADELKEMAAADQIAAGIPQGKYSTYSQEEWLAFKDSVFRGHTIKLKEVFAKEGFVGVDRAGKEGALHFWLMVQHSDHDPKFQIKVLERMKLEIERSNANPSNYALLVDRVKLNTGQQQVYGSQVDYNLDIAQAFPRHLEEPKLVNNRRKLVGLEPIEVYLNEMSQMHFEMNKDYYMQKGVNAPTFYTIKGKP